MVRSRNLIERLRRLSKELCCASVLAGLTLAAWSLNPVSPSIACAQDGDEITIVDVVVEGNQTIPESVILQKIQAQPQRAISERLIREDKRSLLNTRWFFEVRERLDETPQGLVLVFVVKERPIVQKVEFRGNKKVKLKHLKAWTGLKAGSPFDYIANQEAVRRIEQEYKDKGYYFVEVQLTKGGQPGDREVVFDIKEGPKVQVKQRTFEGNVFWSDADLRKNLISKEAFLIFGGLFNPDTLPSDIEAVKAFYRSVGFFDVEVTGEPLFSDDRSDVNLHFKVTEGVRYKVRDVQFEGNSLIATSKLRDDSKLLPGQYFESYPLSKDVNRMLGYYGDMGHYFASVNPVPHFTETPGVVDLVFEVDEDRPRYIREINVHYDGDYPHTKQTVVLDRIQVQPGDLAIPKLVRRGRSRLNGSGLFEPGIVFDVQPVEPEQTSFASMSRMVRGQNPATGTDQWTERFVQAVHTVEPSVEIGNYEAILGTGYSEDSAKETQPAQATADAPADFGDSQDLKSPDPSLSMRPQGIPSSFSYVGAHTESEPTVARTESRVLKPEGRSVSPGHSFATPLSQPTKSTQAANPSLAVTETSSFSSSMTTPFSEAVADPGLVTPMFESEAVEFRSVDASSLFSADTSTFVASAEMMESEEPIIRAQSPDGLDSSAPRREDAMINESPYRNQFRDIPPGWVDINVNATEGRTGRLMFGAGVNSNAGLVGNFVWDESNFDLFRPPTTFSDVLEGRAWRGGGQRFRAEAAPGNQVSRYALTWTDPYFMYTDYSLSVSGFYFNRYYPNWTEDRVGGRVSVGKQFTPEWSGALALRLEQVEMRDVDTPTPAIVLPLKGTSFLSTGRVSVTHDTRDSSMMPTEGHYFDAGYEQAFNDFHYPKLDSEFRQYFTLHNRADGSGRQVLTVAGSVGWSGDDTPVFERYYAGGFQSFRGFRFRGVTPRSPSGFATGGTFQALGTVEYRVPVTADDMINVVAFSDFGTVDDEVTLARFRATAGFGVRVVIPAMGPVPLAFDFAFPIMSEDIDNEQVFSFYVGINR